MIRNTENVYGGVAKLLHWVIAILVIGMLIYGFCLDDIPREYRGMAIYSHKLIGMTILFLMILRTLWSLINKKPILPFNTKTWEKWAEHFVHYSFYAILFAMPIVGWMGSVAAGKPPFVDGWTFNLPIAYNKDFSHLLFRLHKQLAIIIIAFLLVHIVAALFHHFIRRDNVLRRMMP